jgi:hypothetical protein
MTTVRAHCPTCGDVKLQIHDITVRVCVDAAVSSAYRFCCPGCGRAVNRPASARIIDLLVSSGAPREQWHWPAELAERPEGPALTHDDLLDLHLLLGDDGWFDDLVALVRRTTPE